MKKTYIVYIEEKLCRGTEIEAESIDEAEEIAKKMYRNSEIVLDSNDTGTEPEMMTEEIGEGENKESTDWHEF